MAVVYLHHAACHRLMDSAELSSRAFLLDMRDLHFRNCSISLSCEVGSWDKSVHTWGTNAAVLAEGDKGETRPSLFSVVVAKLRRRRSC